MVEADEVEALEAMEGVAEGLRDERRELVARDLKGEKDRVGMVGKRVEEDISDGW